MNRGTCAVIDLSALKHNYERIKSVALNSRILSVVKADGYGHGMSSIANALRCSDGFGVAILDEALLLRASGFKQTVVLMEGVFSRGELEEVSNKQIDIVVHQKEQVALLEAGTLPSAVNVWLKIDTGMNRLGVNIEQAPDLFARLKCCDNVSSITLMSHFACADDVNASQTQTQYEAFQQATQHYNYPKSMANSAGIFRDSRFHFDWVRPGIALYGTTPVLENSTASLGLLPVMTVQSKVISLRALSSGDSVGYGATWTATKPTTVAVVAIGYGDGYPRHVDSRAYVLIDGQRCPVVGRVSMDMLTVDVSSVTNVALGDPVVLWGKGLPVEVVASWADTVNYELLCQVTERVEHRYILD